MRARGSLQYFMYLVHNSKIKKKKITAKEKAKLVCQSQGPEAGTVTHRQPVGFQVPCPSNSALPSLSADREHKFP